MAIIGVIFFGLLASQASASADALVPKMYADLQRAGVPVSAQDRIVDEFEACFRERATEKDPSVVPPSCRKTEEQKSVAHLSPGTMKRVEDAMGSAAVEARERDFTTSIERTLYWEVDGFLAVFLLTFLLPEKPRPQMPGQPPEEVRQKGGHR